MNPNPSQGPARCRAETHYNTARQLWLALRGKHDGKYNERISRTLNVSGQVLQPARNANAATSSHQIDHQGASETRSQARRVATGEKDWSQLFRQGQKGAKAYLEAAGLTGGQVQSSCGGDLNRFHLAPMSAAVGTIPSIERSKRATSQSDPHDSFQNKFASCSHATMSGSEIAYRSKRSIVCSSSVRGETSCTATYRRRQGPQLFPLPHREAFLKSVPDQEPMTGSALLRGQYSEKSRAWRCTTSPDSRPALARNTSPKPRRHVASRRGISFSRCCGASRANRSSAPSWRAATRNGGSSFKSTNAWGARLSASGEV